MPDGVRLAADLYLPDGPGPFAALLEALPYRKDDLTSSYADEYRRLVTEGHFAVCRVDLRGTGSSEGDAEDEYPEVEQRDLAEVIAWLAARPWSNGRVGMFGTSYSGFNSIQMACERPPALGAICAIYATDDRYTDDVHYMGGALRAVDLVDYCHYMTPMNALPPAPAVYGDGWRDEWRRRVEQMTPWLLRWLQEQRDGPYWRHGSLRPDYERITCATMLVGGWADGYRNNSLRTFEALQGPKALLMGPWSHMSTATSLPGPHIDLVPEMIRWFARWLRDERNGVDDEAPIRLFVRHATTPQPDLDVHEGTWRYEPDWPLTRSRTLTLVPEGDGDDVLDVRPDVGTSAWISCAGRLPWGQPMDQRGDDAWSLTYDWTVTAPVEILGYPRLRLELRSTAPVAQVSAKLVDVFPDGTAALVTRGLLNLAHRASSTDPTPLEPGAPVEVDVELEAAAYLFEPNHRIRLSIAGADWPNTWPTPEKVTLEVARPTITLALPTLEGATPISSPPEFYPPPEGEHDEEGDEQPTTWRFEHDVLGRVTRAVVDHGTSYPTPHDGRVTEAYHGEVSVSRRDPGDASARASCRFEVTWPDATCTAEARLVVQSDAKRFDVAIDLETTEGGRPFVSRSWRQTIPRDHL
jgi:predicted acyl esterase